MGIDEVGIDKVGIDEVGINRAKYWDAGGRPVCSTCNRQLSRSTRATHMVSKQ